MALFAEISSSYVYGEMAHPAPINQTLHLVTLTQVYSPDGWYESVEDLEQTERNFEFQSSRALALVFIPAVSHLA